MISNYLNILLLTEHKTRLNVACRIAFFKDDELGVIILFRSVLSYFWVGRFVASRGTLNLNGLETFGWDLCKLFHFFL